MIPNENGKTRAMQATLATTARFTGAGLHSGAPARLTINPAPAGHGIMFRRTDLGGALVPARWDHVEPSKLCTLLRGPGGASVSTVEHVMAALAGTGVHNALIDIDGPEVPILDGSAAPFVAGILKAGLRFLDAPLCAIRVLRPVEVHDGAGFARLSPADNLEMEFAIDFADAAIGHQEKTLKLANGAFQPPLEPGTEPLTMIRPRSLSVLTTCRFCVVTRTEPRWPAIFLPLNTLPGSWHCPVEPCERWLTDTPCDARRPPKL